MFEVKQAIQNPNAKTLYPWEKMNLGQGFFAPLSGYSKPPKPSAIANAGNEWAKRRGFEWKFEAFKHTLDGVEGIQVNRVR